MDYVTDCKSRLLSVAKMRCRPMLAGAGALRQLDGQRWDWKRLELLQRSSHFVSFPLFQQISITFFHEPNNLTYLDLVFDLVFLTRFASVGTTTGAAMIAATIAATTGAGTTGATTDATTGGTTGEETTG